MDVPRDTCAVSREEADFVRRAFETFGAAGVRGEIMSPEGWFHPEVEYREDVSWPGARTVRGVDAVRTRFLEYGEVMRPTAWITEDVIDAGDAVVYIFNLKASTIGQNFPTEHRWAYLVRMRDGLIGSVHAYLDPQEALAAADVSG